MRAGPSWSSAAAGCGSCAGAASSAAVPGHPALGAIPGRGDVTSDQGGLLSIAFAPGYRRTGRFYAFYTHTDRTIHVDEFRRSRRDRNRAPRTSGRTVLRVPRTSRRGPRRPAAVRARRAALCGCGLRRRPRPTARISPASKARSCASIHALRRLAGTGFPRPTHSCDGRERGPRSMPTGSAIHTASPSTAARATSRSQIQASPASRRSTSCERRRRRRQFRLARSSRAGFARAPAPRRAPCSRCWRSDTRSAAVGR